MIKHVITSKSNDSKLEVQHSNEINMVSLRIITDRDESGMDVTVRVDELRAALKARVPG